jgi:hypothetical protein
MLYQDPETYLRMMEQDRDRRMAERALERAARSGGVRRTGLRRGGLSGLAVTLREVGEATKSLRRSGSRPAEA